MTARGNGRQRLHSGTARVRIQFKRKLPGAAPAPAPPPAPHRRLSRRSRTFSTPRRKPGRLWAWRRPLAWRRSRSAELGGRKLGRPRHGGRARNGGRPGHGRPEGGRGEGGQLVAFASPSSLVGEAELGRGASWRAAVRSGAPGFSRGGWGRWLGPGTCRAGRRGTHRRPGSSKSIGRPCSCSSQQRVWRP